MKKSVFSLLLALLLCLSFLLSACKESTPISGGGETTTLPPSASNDTPQKKEDNSNENKDTPPAGYLFAEHDTIRFAYPASWVEDLTASTPTYEHPTKYSWISLQQNEATDQFHTMTAEEYQETYGASFAEELGGTMFNVTAQCLTNDHDLEIATFSCFITVDGLTLKQLLYAVNIGDVSYRLVLLLDETNEALEQTILQSIKEIEPKKEPDTSTTAPMGYQYYTNTDLRFIFPSSWDSSSIFNFETNESINVTVGYSASIYSEMNSTQFDALIKSALEAQGFVVSTPIIEQKQNTNGIDIRVIAYSTFHAPSRTEVQQQIFAFTMNRTAYALVLTLESTNDQLAPIVFESIENLNPEQNPPSETDTRTISHLNISFDIPATFGTTEVTTGVIFYRGPSSITITSGEKNSSFDTITLEDFKSEYLPELEQSLGATVQNLSLERFYAPSNLYITSICYTFHQYGTDFYQTNFIVTVDQTTHVIAITATTEDMQAELAETIEGTILPIDGPNYGENS